ncbi:MAG: nucleotidyltransferase domain-containing protein [Candidatus Hydrogenedentota bacterium]
MKSISVNKNNYLKIEANIKEKIDKTISILKGYGAKDIYLFGSILKNRFSVYSDVDIAVSGLPEERYFEIMAKITDVLKRPVDLIDLDEKTIFTEYLKNDSEELYRVG